MKTVGTKPTKPLVPPTNLGAVKKVAATKPESTSKK